jgi:hypothetical protein
MGFVSARIGAVSSSLRTRNLAEAVLKWHRNQFLNFHITFALPSFVTSDADKVLTDLVALGTSWVRGLPNLVLKSVVRFCGLYFVRLTEGSIVRDLALTSLIIIGRPSIIESRGRPPAGYTIRHCDGLFVLLYFMCYLYEHIAPYFRVY